MEYAYENSKFALQAEPEFPLGLGLKLHRLVAKRDIGKNVKAGDKGGLVAGPMNLSEEGESWIYDESLVYAGAIVEQDATVRGGAQLSGRVVMRDRCSVRGTITILGHFTLTDDLALEADDTLLVNMQATRFGQYVYQGQTIFVPEYQLTSSASSAISLPAEQCTQRLAVHLACRQSGDRVSFIRRGRHPLDMLQPNEDGAVTIDTVLKQLASMRGY